MMDDQPSNFYMVGTMGLASSIGLGLALAQKQKVIAIDGDGSIESGPLAPLALGTLPAGSHTIVVEKREVTPAGQQPRLDVLCFSKNGSTPPLDSDVVLSGGGN